MTDVPSELADDDYVTLTGVQTLSNKTFSGPVSFYTNGGRIGITDATTPLAAPASLVHIVNTGSTAGALRASSYLTGSTGAPYQNNDCSLWETFNNIVSDSLNLSWSGSFPNGYNNIPEGVTDSGARVGVIGWAVSVAIPGQYEHKGTLDQQIGIRGTAGFQGSGSGTNAIVNNATGVRGEIYNDSTGSTITNARAGEFIAVASIGEVANNIAVYAHAENGNNYNYSFWGDAGTFYNAGQVELGLRGVGQSGALVVARGGGNSYEFGNPDPGGFGSTIGSTYSAGYPFIAFNAEAETSGNTFKTRGKAGSIVCSDNLGALIFGRFASANSGGQAIAETARFTSAGQFVTQGKIAIGTGGVGILPQLAARAVGNDVEFGFPTAGGYGSNLGATPAHGYPFLGFCCEAETSGDTFRTRGKIGTVITNDLSGSMVFARLANANAAGQSLTEMARFNPDGALKLQQPPILATKTPASATAPGTTGQFCWDAGYLYVCVATDTWKRVALAAW